MPGRVAGLFRCGHTLAQEVMTVCAQMADGWLQADQAARDFPMTAPQLAALAAAAVRELNAAGVLPGPAVHPGPARAAPGGLCVPGGGNDDGHSPGS